MEPMQCDETARASILELFKKRALFVPNVENLSLAQLQQIYDRFAVPQPRRERRERSRHDVLDEKLPVEMENLMQRIKVVYVVGEKRSPSSSSPFHSSEPKRLKRNEREDVGM
ncbi:uncharacterized protein LOC132796187 [Drosophila nasuta]|uniref:uncharacterized protein LOC132796187 n=1 Tax=Drosophila nasuta TaxID=42062 RepID=UPI00295EE230|nr:uncharacterized protein LOC132796187 [Drosophila nasuta]